jgi:hypothetical protein
MYFTVDLERENFGPDSPYRDRQRQIEWMLYRAGASEMKEKAAQMADKIHAEYGDSIGDAIRAIEVK